MKSRQKVFIVITAIILGTFLTWYLQVYKNHTTTPPKKSLIASIPPVKYIVYQIVGDDFNITTLLSEGMSPETYEPTPKEIIATSDAQMIFTTGLLDFENTIVNKIHDTSNAIIADLSAGIKLIDGNDSHKDNVLHNHGTDPHIWTSFDCLQVMAKNAYDNIKALYPDSSKYYNNYMQLIDNLKDADKYVREKITQSGINYILIYHPALTYYARDYNIRQIALENEGKEPTADRMKSIIEQTRNDSTKTVLYQKQLNESIVTTIAKDINAEPVAFDPLEEDAVQNLLWVTDIITRQ